MDDLDHGSRNKRGDWQPTAHLEVAPLWSWPIRPARLLGWLAGYVWPWNAFFLATTVLWCLLVLPPAEVRQQLAVGWIAQLLAANWLGVFLFYGAFELRLYVLRTQGQRFKYNGRFPADQPSDVFWFKSQNLDNILRSLFVSVPIGTAIEAGLLWQQAQSGHDLSWSTQPGLLAVLILIAPLIHEVHFFVIHRAIHWGPLYRWVHAVHHNSINPTPWSSLSMHPVESFAYFGVAFWSLLMPESSWLPVFFFHMAAFGAIVGHIGFDRLELPGGAAPRTTSYAHYLHHKHFDVNYCDNGTFALDLWTGSWHDGSPEGARLMQERYERKRARMNPSA